jgi:hypothetical protein
MLDELFLLRFKFDGLDGAGVFATGADLNPNILVMENMDSTGASAGAGVGAGAGAGAPSHDHVPDDEELTASVVPFVGEVVELNQDQLLAEEGAVVAVVVDPVS